MPDDMDKWAEETARELTLDAELESQRRHSFPLLADVRHAVNKAIRLTRQKWADLAPALQEQVKFVADAANRLTHHKGCQSREEGGCDCGLTNLRIALSQLQSRIYRG